jgi:hypothetical protein
MYTGRTINPHEKGTYNLTASDCQILTYKVVAVSFADLPCERHLNSISFGIGTVHGYYAATQKIIDELFEVMPLGLAYSEYMLLVNTLYYQIRMIGNAKMFREHGYAVAAHRTSYVERWSNDTRGWVIHQFDNNDNLIGTLQTFDDIPF